MSTKSFLSVVLLVLIVMADACRKSGPPPKDTFQATAGSEINEAKVSELTGVPLKILKTESIGYSIINRFYWVRVEGRPAKDKLLEIAKAAIDQVIAEKPAAYHSFTLHFVSSLDMKSGEETKVSYAKATFLPEGDWQKVGRMPIDGYGTYLLECTVNPVK